MAKKTNDIRNRTWRNNQQLVKQTYFDILRASGRKPLIDEVAEATGLSARSVRKHIEAFEFEPSEHPYRLFTDDMIAAIFKWGMEGSVGMATLFMKIFHPQLFKDTEGPSTHSHTTVIMIPHNARESEYPDEYWAELESEVKSLE